MRALTGARLFTGDVFCDDAAVLIDGSRIAAVVMASDVPADADRLDLGGGVLAPGFIDVQVNGGGGVLFNADPTVDGIRRIAEAHRQFGTTGLLPTVISDAPSVTAAAIAATEGAIEAGVPGVLGVHVEGPFLNPDRRGVHAAWHIRLPEPDDLDLLAAPRRGKTLVTLAPEMVRPGTIARLAEAGVIVSLGHTEASYATMLEAFRAGASGITHLYNAMSQLGSREPGAVGAALQGPSVWSGIIADMHHVHPASLTLAARAKGGRVMLVTDAMPPVGTDDTCFRLYDDEIFVDGGACLTEEGRLAGSVLDMATALRNVMDYCAVPFDEALRMASRVPAAFLGLDTELGSIAPGFRADLVLLDDALRVRKTWIGGDDGATP